MNLAHMFEIQRELDHRIVEKHGLQGEDLLSKKILALQVELAECAAEWRGFKFWSENQEPRNRNVSCHACGGVGKFYFSYFSDIYIEPCGYCDGSGVQEKNPLLEEYVDCLHFILSIGIERDMKLDNYTYCNDSLRRLKQSDSYNEQEIITKLILNLMRRSLRFDIEEGIFYYSEFLDGFFALGELLGFTWDEIEQAYLKKNKVNHARQERGY